MPIVVQHQPAMAAIGNAGYIGGLGPYYDRQQQTKMQLAQLYLRDLQQQRGLAANMASQQQAQQAALQRQLLDAGLRQQQLNAQHQYQRQAAQNQFEQQKQLLTHEYAQRRQTALDQLDSQGKQRWKDYDIALEKLRKAKDTGMIDQASYDDGARQIMLHGIQAFDEDFVLHKKMESPEVKDYVNKNTTVMDGVRYQIIPNPDNPDNPEVKKVGEVKPEYVGRPFYPGDKLPDGTQWTGRGIVTYNKDGELVDAPGGGGDKEAAKQQEVIAKQAQEFIEDAGLDPQTAAKVAQLKAQAFNDPAANERYAKYMQYAAKVPQLEHFVEDLAKKQGELDLLEQQKQSGVQVSDAAMGEAKAAAAAAKTVTERLAKEMEALKAEFAAAPAPAPVAATQAAPPQPQAGGPLPILPNQLTSPAQNYEPPPVEMTAPNPVPGSVPEARAAALERLPHLLPIPIGQPLPPRSQMSMQQQAATEVAIQETVTTMLRAVDGDFGQFTPSMKQHFEALNRWSQQ